MSDRTGVTLVLDREEAIVLFDFLQREIDVKNGAHLGQAVQHDGELWALNGLNCLLEKQLVEPFGPDFANTVAQARTQLAKRCGVWPV
ncbi:MAG: hypothetical protein KDJ29_10615 [Hyphomicrobiales bacterium]|nr:hypothetical protein [Hyphomicrobiales bacterium]